MAITLDGNLGILSPDFEPSGSTTPTNGLFLPTTNSLGFATNSTERLRLDASGNLGLGVTPSAWGSGRTAIQLGGSTSSNFAGGLVTALKANTHYNGGDFYTATGFSSQYVQSSGTHSWYTAPSGTAGNAISFTQAMTLDASGNLGIGTTTATGFTKTIRLNTASGTTGLLLCDADTDRAGFYIDAGTTAPAYLFTNNSKPLVFSVAGSERARIDSSGNLLVGTTTSAGFGSANRIYRNVSQGNFILSVDAGSEYSAAFLAVSGGGFNIAGTAQYIGRNSTNSRSINAGGTVNASGADYAEYMVKAGDFTFNKGDVCGINADGLLTNVFADAVSFVVKSTDPSYVGGDSWGASIEDQDALEIERQKVDRIAFAGQVPVNVLGASPGDYIVPIDDSGSIKGEAVANPTLEQYQKAVGKVIAIEADGRARIIVKVA